MTRLELRSGSSEHTARIGASLAQLLQPGDVVALTGDLGAGKTRLVQGVAAGLGVADHVTSPTFGLLGVHQGRLELDHFDLYRLERVEELEDVDFWGVLESGGVAFVEWGDRFPEALPADYVEVEIRILSAEERLVVVRPHGGARPHALAREWAEACGGLDRGGAP